MSDDKNSNPWAEARSRLKSRESSSVAAAAPSADDSIKDFGRSRSISARYRVEVKGVPVPSTSSSPVPFEICPPTAAVTTLHEAAFNRPILRETGLSESIRQEDLQRAQGDDASHTRPPTVPPVVCTTPSRSRTERSRPFKSKRSSDSLPSLQPAHEASRSGPLPAAPLVSSTSRLVETGSDIALWVAEEPKQAPHPSPGEIPVMETAYLSYPDYRGNQNRPLSARSPAESSGSPSRGRKQKKSPPKPSIVHPQTQQQQPPAKAPGGKGKKKRRPPGHIEKDGTPYWMKKLKKKILKGKVKPTRPDELPTVEFELKGAPPPGPIVELRVTAPSPERGRALKNASAPLWAGASLRSTGNADALLQGKDMKTSLPQPPPRSEEDGGRLEPYQQQDQQKVAQPVRDPSPASRLVRPPTPSGMAHMCSRSVPPPKRQGPEWQTKLNTPKIRHLSQPLSADADWTQKEGTSMQPIPVEESYPWHQMQQQTESHRVVAVPQSWEEQQSTFRSAADINAALGPRQPAPATGGSSAAPTAAASRSFDPPQQPQKEPMVSRSRPPASPRYTYTSASPTVRTMSPPTWANQQAKYRAASQAPAPKPKAKPSWAAPGLKPTPQGGTIKSGQEIHYQSFLPEPFEDMPPELRQLRMEQHAARKAEQEAKLEPPPVPSPPPKPASPVPQRRPPSLQASERSIPTSRNVAFPAPERRPSDDNCAPLSSQAVLVYDDDNSMSDAVSALTEGVVIDGHPDSQRSLKTEGRSTGAVKLKKDFWQATPEIETRATAKPEELRNTNKKSSPVAEVEKLATPKSEALPTPVTRTVAGAKSRRALNNKDYTTSITTTITVTKTTNIPDGGGSIETNESAAILAAAAAAAAAIDANSARPPVWTGKLKPTGKVDEVMKGVGIMSDAPSWASTDGGNPFDEGPPFDEAVATKAAMPRPPRGRAFMTTASAARAPLARPRASSLEPSQQEAAAPKTRSLSVGPTLPSPQPSWAVERPKLKATGSKGIDMKPRMSDINGESGSSPARPTTEENTIRARPLWAAGRPSFTLKATGHADDLLKRVDIKTRSAFSPALTPRSHRHRKSLEDRFSMPMPPDPTKPSRFRVINLFPPGKKDEVKQGKIIQMKRKTPGPEKEDLFAKRVTSRNVVRPVARSDSDLPSDEEHDCSDVDTQRNWIDSKRPREPMRKSPDINPRPRPCKETPKAEVRAESSMSPDDEIELAMNSPDVVIQQTESHVEVSLPFDSFTLQPDSKPRERNDKRMNQPEIVRRAKSRENDVVTLDTRATRSVRLSIAGPRDVSPSNQIELSLSRDECSYESTRSKPSLAPWAMPRTLPAWSARSYAQVARVEPYFPVDAPMEEKKTDDPVIELIPNANETHAAQEMDPCPAAKDEMPINVKRPESPSRVLVPATSAAAARNSHPKEAGEIEERSLSRSASRNDPVGLKTTKTVRKTCEEDAMEAAVTQVNGVRSKSTPLQSRGGLPEREVGEVVDEITRNAVKAVDDINEVAYMIDASLPRSHTAEAASRRRASPNLDAVEEITRAAANSVVEMERSLTSRARCRDSAPPGRVKAVKKIIKEAVKAVEDINETAVIEVNRVRSRSQSPTRRSSAAKRLRSRTQSPMPRSRSRSPERATEEVVDEITRTAIEAVDDINEATVQGLMDDSLARLQLPPRQGFKKALQENTRASVDPVHKINDTADEETRTTSRPRSRSPKRSRTRSPKPSRRKSPIRTIDDAVEEITRAAVEAVDEINEAAVEEVMDASTPRMEVEPGARSPRPRIGLPAGTVEVVTRAAVEAVDEMALDEMMDTGLQRSPPAPSRRFAPKKTPGEATEDALAAVREAAHQGVTDIMDASRGRSRTRRSRSPRPRERSPTNPGEEIVAMEEITVESINDPSRARSLPTEGVDASRGRKTSQRPASRSQSPKKSADAVDKTLGSINAVADQAVVQIMDASRSRSRSPWFHSPRPMAESPILFEVVEDLLDGINDVADQALAGIVDGGERGRSRSQSPKMNADVAAEAMNEIKRKAVKAVEELIDASKKSRAAPEVVGQGADARPPQPPKIPVPGAPLEFFSDTSSSHQEPPALSTYSNDGSVLSSLKKIPSPDAPAEPLTESPTSSKMQRLPQKSPSPVKEKLLASNKQLQNKSPSPVASLKKSSTSSKQQLPPSPSPYSPVESTKNSPVSRKRQLPSRKSPEPQPLVMVTSREEYSLSSTPQLLQPKPLSPQPPTLKESPKKDTLSPHSLNGKSDAIVELSHQITMSPLGASVSSGLNPTSASAAPVLTPSGSPLPPVAVMRTKPKHCAQCGSVEIDGYKFKYCGKCRLVKYCSRHCQKKNWKTHKLHCCKQIQEELYGI